jgi:hypothetical protein
MDPYPRALFLAVCEAVPAWVKNRVIEVAERNGVVIDGTVRAHAETAAAEVTNLMTSRLAEMLLTDVDQQVSNPLHIIRSSIGPATDLLRELGVEPPKRDEFDSMIMPEDFYALGPHTWRDLSEEVHEAGINWGAWKAATVLQRRRAEGKIS